MRTTLTLDSDVAALLKRPLKAGKTSRKQLLNDALRIGLHRLSTPPPRRKRYYTRQVDLGPCLVGSIDNVAKCWPSGGRELQVILADSNLPIDPFCKYPLA